MFVRIIWGLDNKVQVLFLRIGITVSFWKTSEFGHNKVYYVSFRLRYIEKNIGARLGILAKLFWVQWHSRPQSNLAQFVINV